MNLKNQNLKFLSLILAFILFQILCLKYFINQIDKKITENFKNVAKNVAYDHLVQRFKVYTVFNQGLPARLVRHGKAYDGGYVVPEIAFEKADVLFGYGIYDDISFEEQFSDKYKKPSYGFDCGIEKIEIKNKLCTFVRECIAHDAKLHSGQKTSGFFSNFEEQITKRGFKNKKIFVKMDIEGAEYDAFDSILEHAENVTGIVLEIHVQTHKEARLATQLLKKLEKDFYLIHLHANSCAKTFETNYSNGKLSKAMELTFINKNLVEKAELKKSQKFPLEIDMPNCPEVVLEPFELFPSINE